MPYQELPGLGMAGLNTDTPAQALDHTAFSDGTNLRPFDGSLQTVFGFNTPDNNITPTDRLNVFTFTSWIQTGEPNFRASYLFLDADNKYKIQVVNDITGTTAINDGAVTLDGPTSIASNLGAQLFAFNGVLVANTGAPGGPEFFNFPDPDDDVPQLDSAGWLGAEVSCKRIIPYQGRLVALNIQGEYLTNNLGNSTIVWSTPIETINDISGVNFAFTANNSAGDDILTETPGEVVDGGALGQALIIYKDDAVYRYQDIGAPLFLVGEPLFTDDGIYGSNCFVDIGGGRHFVMGNFGCYIHDGGPNRQDVSRDTIQKTLYSDIAEKQNTFCFHNVNDKEVWICYQDTASGVGTNKAYVFNYELGVWHKRTLPLGTRGVHAAQQDGELYIYAFGDYGVRKLSDEREAEPIRNAGDIEIYYLAFGDNSKVKYLSAIYPHAMGKVTLDIETSNNVGNFGGFSEPDEEPLKQTFDGSTNSYKLDYREHGRFYHIKVSAAKSEGAGMTYRSNNPSLTGIGFSMKLGGDR